MAKKRLMLRVDEGLLDAVDAVVPAGGRTSWIEDAMRSWLEASSGAKAPPKPGATVVLVPELVDGGPDGSDGAARERSSPMKFRERTARTVDLMGEALDEWVRGQLPLKASEAKDMVSTAKGLVDVAVAYEALDDTGEIPDEREEQLGVLLRIVSEARGERSA